MIDEEEFEFIQKSALGNRKIGLLSVLILCIIILIICKNDIELALSGIGVLILGAFIYNLWREESFLQVEKIREKYRKLDAKSQKNAFFYHMYQGSAGAYRINAMAVLDEDCLSFYHFGYYTAFILAIPELLLRPIFPKPMELKEDRVLKSSITKISIGTMPGFIPDPRYIDFEVGGMQTFRYNILWPLPPKQTEGRYTMRFFSAGLKQFDKFAGLAKTNFGAVFR
jgi:hypothetical protein